MIDYNQKIAENFFKVPGEHLLQGGVTGSGKTQGLYYLLNGLMYYAPEEIILWLDTGKTGELLRLSEWQAVRVLVPDGCEVKIDLYEGKTLKNEIEIKYFIKPDHVLDMIVKDKINVLCLEPFYADPEEYATVITQFFRALIEKARRYEVQVPLAIFIDEFQWIAPGQGHTLNDEHKEGSKWIQRNVEMLRSMQIRIIAATQAWTKIRKGVRSSFNWLMIRRGFIFENDQPRLKSFNHKWQALADNTAVFVFPSKYFSDFIVLPFFGDGRDLGRVYYFDNRSKGGIRPSIPRPALGQDLAQALLEDLQNLTKEAEREQDPELRSWYLDQVQASVQRMAGQALLEDQEEALEALVDDVARVRDLTRPGPGAGPNVAQGQALEVVPEDQALEVVPEDQAIPEASGYSEEDLFD